MRGRSSGSITARIGRWRCSRRTASGPPGAGRRTAGVGVDDQQVDRALGGQQRLFRIALDHRAVLDRQLRGDALGLALVVVADHDPPARAGQARGGAGDHADPAAGGLALAQFVDHRLQARQAAHARK